MSERWVARILRLAPRSFRERYAEELLATHRERARAAQGGGRVMFGLREVMGTAALVVRLRLGLVATGVAGESGGVGDRADRPAVVLASVWQDLRFAARSVRRNPGHSAATAGVLALGIGATSAISSAVDAYFFQPLPFAEPERLVTVFETNPEFGWVDETAAPANLLDWREGVGSFADVSGYVPGTDELTLPNDGEPVVLLGSAVLGNFFSTLGVSALHGRTFRFEESWRGDDEVVVLSHDLWVSRFGADPAIVGRTIEIGRGRREVVGVMPEGFRFPHDDIELWYPIGWDAADRDMASFRRAHYVRAFARLAPGATHEQADAELQAVARRLQVEYPATNSVMGAGIQPLRDFLVADVRGPLAVLLAAAVFLLLLACTNVANLQLVRASERSADLTLRRALGARPARLVRAVLFESLILALAGGAAGLALGWIGIRSIRDLAELGIGGATSVTLDHRIALVTLAAAGLSAVLFAVGPALRVIAAGRDHALPERARGATVGREHLRLAGTLVSVQLALALLLAAGAGLMIKSFWLLGRVDPGFRAEGVLAVRFTVPETRYPNRDQVLAFYDRLAADLEGRPGIERVGSVASLPLDGQNWSSQFQAEGWPADRVGFEILHRRADRGYFEALEIPLVRGRLPGPDDRAGAPSVVVVNESFARQYFPGEDPVGRRIAFTRSATPESNWYEIIGVVGDQRQEGLVRPVRPEVFESRDQDWGRNNWWVIRGAGDALAIEAVVRDVLAELDPLIPLASVRTLDGVRAASLSREQLMLRLLSAFGITALLLATVGVYAVTSRAARRRTQEVGIRIALGARGVDVVRLMLREGMVVVTTGLVVGVAASLVATRALRSFLYGVEPTDPATLAAVATLLGVVALVACWVPARRACAVDPTTSLRAE